MIRPAWFLPVLACVLALSGACPGTAWAQVEDELPATPEVRQTVPSGPSEQDGPYGGPLWQRGFLLGDPGRVRSRLAARGVTAALLEQAEVLGNVSGGTRRGAAFGGLLTMEVALDTEAAGLWPGGTFQASALQIHGRGLSLDNLDNTLTPEPATTALALRIRDTHTQQLRRTPSARSA